MGVVLEIMLSVFTGTMRQHVPRTPSLHLVLIKSSQIQITIKTAHLNPVMIGQSIEITEVTQTIHQTIIPIKPVMASRMVEEQLVQPILVETIIIPRIYNKVRLAKNNLKNFENSTKKFKK